MGRGEQGPQRGGVECTPSGGPSAPGRRLSHTKLSFCLLAAVIIRCCRWQKEHTCECEQTKSGSLCSRQRSLAALTTPGSRAQDFGADRCRRSAPRTGLQTRRECFGRCSIERSTPAADARAARGGGGSRHRGHAFCGARQEVGAGRGNGERGALCGGLKGQRGASAHAEHANFAQASR